MENTMAFMILLAHPPSSVAELNQVLESAGVSGAQYFQDPLTAMEALCMVMAQDEGVGEGATSQPPDLAAEGKHGNDVSTPAADSASSVLASLTPDRATAALDIESLDIVAQTQVGDTLAAVSEVVQAISTIKHFGQELLLQQVRRLAGVEGTPLIDPWAPHAVEAVQGSHHANAATLH
jgi:hypothetical protein